MNDKHILVMLCATIIHAMKSVPYDEAVKRAKYILAASEPESDGQQGGAATGTALNGSHIKGE